MPGITGSENAKAACAVSNSSNTKRSCRHARARAHALRSRLRARLRFPPCFHAFDHPLPGVQQNGGAHLLDERLLFGSRCLRGAPIPTDH
eukprot:COSAG01_NODE_37843_length_498_cov_0.774436_1_plen_90_part_00